MNPAYPVEEITAAFQAESDRVNGAAKLTTGTLLIEIERARQITEEGFDAKHDEKYEYGEQLASSLTGNGA